ncbi:unnamed protein product [Linum trigynum]|uniref:Uncharacterized protein n=1 Tax=Linum trigynum TaxID=586398 RepID=A0AAV2G3T8_9ROSI
MTSASSSLSFIDYARASACGGGSAVATGRTEISASSIAARVSACGGGGVVDGLYLSYDTIIMPQVAMTRSSIWIARLMSSYSFDDLSEGIVIGTRINGSDTK